MEQRYYVAILAESGWQRVSRSVTSVRQAQLLHTGLSERYPRACVVAEVANACNSFSKRALEYA